MAKNDDPRTPLEKAFSGVILLYGGVSAPRQVGICSQEHEADKLFKLLAAMRGPPDRIRLIAD